MNVFSEHRVQGLAGSAFALALMSTLFYPSAAAATSDPVFTDQGKEWTASERTAFYSQDQGSQLIPLKWIEALKFNGKPFLEQLYGYGYLPNDKSNPPGLPVGFTVNDGHLGLNCAACHTRQIDVDNTSYRIDGGPAISDFQTFVLDLDKAVDALLKDQKAFDDFAHAVLGGADSPEKRAELRKEVEAWFLRYDTIMSRALPKDKTLWGPARLDAVGMIFNRLTGLDIGTSPDHIIKDNIHLADAPVRYPFIWNAPIQDITQWPGFADNGDSLLALSRNLGEVIGVFASFYPEKDDWRILGVDYLHRNSANFHGLKALEDHVKKIGPPKWPWTKGPWAVDEALAKQGEKIYESATQTEGGGCAGCHGIKKGAFRSLRHETWATPLCDVGTDTKEYEVLGWEVDTGVLAGAQIPFLEKPLQARDKAFSVLGMAVIGSILQHDSPIAVELESEAKKHAEGIEKLLGSEKADKLKAMASDLRKLQSKLVTSENAELKGAFKSLKDGWQNKPSGGTLCKTDFSAPEPAITFESRVLEGIWATAPYLHNGSVPTLADLLKPVAERATSFKVGPAYDPATVGLATGQTKFDYTYKTTDCSALSSGTSRCGHEFGTKLKPEEKKALLEYLKKL